MRVLHVLSELHPSGAESMLVTASRLFDDLGFDGEVLGTGPSIGPYASKLASAGYRIHHIPFAKTPTFFFRSYRLMRRRRYDVIHLHTEQANFWFGLIALMARPKRVVRAVHNAFTYTGSLHQRRKLQRQVLDRLGVLHVAVGRDVQEVEFERFGITAQLVPNWYDSRRFVAPTEAERRQARASLGVAPDDTVLVSIGHCSSTKNHAALIEAIARLPASARPLYLHVGSEEPGRPEFALADELGVADRIQFLGAVDDVRPIYFGSDIYVMPSLREGRSIAALEALATGLPALLANVAGLRDLAGTYPGLCFAEPTNGSFTEMLSELLSETPEDRRRRSAEYPEITRAHFGIEAGVAKYAAIYRGGG